MFPMTKPAAGTIPPKAVTVAITRRVQPGHDAQMHAWINAGTKLAEQFPGFLGTGWVRPRDGSDEWHMLYRFTDHAALDAWQDSQERKWWLGSADGLVEHSDSEVRVGIEGWFDQPAETTTDATPAPAAPPRWKQATMIWSAFFPVSLVFAFTLAHLVDGFPTVLKVAVQTLVLTPVMTYFVLPFAGRLLHDWLHDN